VKVIVDSMIRLQDVPESILSVIKKELTIKNPDYVKKRAMGLNRWAWGPEWIKLYNEKVVNGVKEYTLPRGYLVRLWTISENNWHISADDRALGNNAKFNSSIKLRDYQSPAVSRAIEEGQGVLIMPCGAGKTETALEVAAKAGCSTLWITHTMDLLNQSMKRAMEKLNLSGKQIGIIQGDNMRIGSHITFATVQTLAKRDLTEISKVFGCVIVDEAHLVFKDASKARMFEDVISQFPAFYRFGITASEYRSDGLIDTMFKVIGPKLYEVDQDDPRLMTMKPRVEIITTQFQYEQPEDELFNVQKMLAEMKIDGQRNALLKSILYNKVTGDDYCLVLGDSLDHLEELQQFIVKQGRLAAFVCGETNKKEREKIMDDMRSGKYHYLFATYQLAKLGLDIPRLNVLVQATPKKDKTSIQQACGRIMRPEEGKAQPVVYDLWDINVPQLKYWGYDRAKVYKTLGCEILGGPKIRGGR
jgi:superfamily II DNA or RNA helicase